MFNVLNKNHIFIFFSKIFKISFQSFRWATAKFQNFRDTLMFQRDNQVADQVEVIFLSGIGLFSLNN